MSDSEHNVRARLKAEAALAPRKKPDEEIVNQRDKEREAEAVKTARLRELRLAKEAAEAQSKPELKAKRRLPRGR